MNRYKVIKQLGDGAFGTVLLAQNKSNGEMVCGGNGIIILPLGTEINFLYLGCCQEDEGQVFQLGVLHFIARSKGRQAGKRSQSYSSYLSSR